MESHPPETPGAHAKRAADQSPLPATLPDLLLVERARCKDTRALETLMRRYNQRLFRIARSIVADEEAAENVVQEAYLLAFADLERYEPTGATGKFGAWLARLAFNQALALRRSIRPSPRTSSVSVSMPNHSVAPETPEAEEEIDEARARQLMEHAIDAMPEVFRTVFVLRAVEKISGIETAACLGINETTVRTRLYRAQRRLRAALDARVPLERGGIFELAGQRGDHIVRQVFNRLSSAELLPSQV